MNYSCFRLIRVMGRSGKCFRKSPKSHLGEIWEFIDFALQKLPHLAGGSPVVLLMMHSGNITIAMGKLGNQWAWMDFHTFDSGIMLYHLDMEHVHTFAIANCSIPKGMLLVFDLHPFWDPRQQRAERIGSLGKTCSAARDPLAAWFPLQASFGEIRNQQFLLKFTIAVNRYDQSGIFFKNMTSLNLSSKLSKGSVKKCTHHHLYPAPSTTPRRWYSTRSRSFVALSCHALGSWTAIRMFRPSCN